MAAAVILGYVSGDYTTKEIVAGYSSSLFITLFGLTLLFGIITTNGCLEQVMRRLINVFGKMVWMVPVILFCQHGVFRLWQEALQAWHLYAALRFPLSMPLVMTR